MIVVQILIGLSLASIALSAQCNYHDIFHYNWSGWSACTQTCGGGTRTRTCPYDNTHETEPCNRVCLNGGEYYGGYCHCRHGTHGPCCDDILECRSNPCQNGGTCNEHINYYTCTCPAGTTGVNCDDIPECASNPCQNGGTCVEHVNYYTCQCPPGTTGPNCDDIPDCLSNPCLNGGTCNEYVNFYTCTCPAGTTGYNCVDIPECASNPCQNGGTCNEMINMYNCSCRDDYIGVHCEKDLFTPYEHSCRYGSRSDCYVVFRRKDSWQDAEEFCEARQGHLAVPNDMDETLFIENFLNTLRSHFPDSRFWIGGHNAGSGTVQWINDETSNVYRWPANVHHDPQGAECVLMDGGYGFLWQSISCDAHMYFVCEESQLFNFIG